MKIHQSLAPEEFQQKAWDFLSQREAENHLMLGIVSNLLRKAPGARVEHQLMVLEAGGEILGAAIRTPPFPWVVTSLSEEWIPLLAEELARQAPAPPGVSGPRTIAFPLCRELASRLGKKESLEMAMGIYQLDEVHAVQDAPGKMRQANPGDMELLVKWSRDFNEEEPLGADFNERAFVEGHLAEQRLFVWENKEAVSMIAYGGNTPNGVRLYMVYTPNFLRRLGYASNLTASLSKMLLDSGRKFCFLFTDMANPTSNHIYQQIGYRHVCAWDVYKIIERRKTASR